MDEFFESISRLSREICPSIYLAMQLASTVNPRSVWWAVLFAVFAVLVPATGDAAQLEFAAGAEDGFAPPTDPASPSAHLQALLGPTANFDHVAGTAGASGNRQIAHTFSGLPAQVVGGTLELRIRGGSWSGVETDGIVISFADASHTSYVSTIAWKRTFGLTAGGGTVFDQPDPGWLTSAEWQAGDDTTVVLDLGRLPTATGEHISILSLINDSGFLDVNVSDETGVDYLRLTLDVQSQTSVPWARISGRQTIRAGLPASYTISYGNVGQADVWDGALITRLDANTQFLLFADSDTLGHGSTGTDQDYYLLTWVPHLAPGDTKHLSLRTTSGFGGGQFAISAGILDDLDLVWSSRSVPSPPPLPTPSGLLSLHGVSTPAASGLATWPDAVEPWGGAPAGYVYNFLFVEVDAVGSPVLCGNRFQEAAISLGGGQIAWAFEGQGVATFDLSAFSTVGGKRFYDSGGTRYQVVDRGAVRPWPDYDPADGSSAAFYVQYYLSVGPEFRAVEEPQDDIAFWNDPPHVSCVGLVYRVLTATWVDKTGDAYWQDFGGGVTNSKLMERVAQLNELAGSAHLSDPGVFESCGEQLLSRFLSFVAASWDPNEKVGPSGPAGNYTGGNRSLSYSIFFENDPDSATAAARTVQVRDTLDPVLDLSSFAFGEIVVGTARVVPPGALKSWSVDVDLRPSRPLIARVEASLDSVTRLVTWVISTIDAETGLPPVDPLAGFLPINLSPPEGEGHVSFTAQPIAGLQTGITIRNSASILFDANPAIVTNEWINVIDNDSPESQIVELDAVQTALSFPVFVDAMDAGAGVEEVVLFASTDGGPFTAVGEVDGGTLEFTGTSGAHYAFYSIAMDSVGNVELAPPGAETETSISHLVAVQQEVGEGLIVRPVPSREAVEFEFHLPSQVQATLRIVDVSGRIVRVLKGPNWGGPGRYTIRWNGADSRGRRAAPGVYFYDLSTRSRATGRVVLVK